MMGGVVLDELPDIVGQDLPVVGLPLRPTQIEVMFLARLIMVGTETFCRYLSQRRSRI